MHSCVVVATVIYGLDSKILPLPVGSRFEEKNWNKLGKHPVKKPIRQH